MEGVVGAASGAGVVLTRGADIDTLSVVLVELLGVAVADALAVLLGGTGRATLGGAPIPIGGFVGASRGTGRGVVGTGDLLGGIGTLGEVSKNLRGAAKERLT